MEMRDHPLLASLKDEPAQIPANQPKLLRLDKSVVCQICKELFRGPVSITCGHSFCSECIRSFLDSMKDKRCPTCDAPAAEASIRRNRALEEIADSWEEARPVVVHSLTTHAGPSRVIARPPHNGKRRRSNDQAPSESGGSNAAGAGQVTELSENDEAPCPLCSARMPIAAIPVHIDKGCPPAKGIETQKSDWKKVFAGAGKSKEKGVEMKRMTKPNYAIATPSELRELLSDYELPTSGDKLTLQARVQQWIILFNSNLDTDRPKSLSALRAMLNETEASRKRDKDRGKDDAVQQLATSDGLAKYARDKKGDFERLRQDILNRSKKGNGKDSPIEVD